MKKNLSRTVSQFSLSAASPSEILIQERPPTHDLQTPEVEAEVSRVSSHPVVRALAGTGVTVIIAGTVRVPPENLEQFRPHMLAMLTASRAEDGCLEYSYAQDVADPGLNFGRDRRMSR